MKKNLFVGLALCVLALGCMEETQEEVKVIPAAFEENNSSPQYSDMVSSVEFIPLETTQASLLGDIEQLIVTEDYIVVSDDMAVKCFDADGKYLHDIGRKGRGHGEYNNFTSISYSGNVVYVCDQRALYSYELSTGKFIEKKEFDEPHYKAFVVDGYVYCFNGIDGIKFYSYQLKDLSEKRLIYENNINPSTEGNLCYANGSLMLVEPFAGLFYKFQNGEMLPFFKYDMGNKAMPVEKFTGKMDYRNYKGMAGFYQFPFVADGYFTFGYTIGNEMRRAVVNLKNDKVFDFNIMNWQLEYKLEPTLSPTYSDGKYFYQTRSAQPPVEYFDNVPSKYSTFNRLKNAQADDNPVVCKIQMNKGFLK